MSPQSDSSPIELVSDERDMKIIVDSDGIMITLLGHRWVVIWNSVESGTRLVSVTGPGVELEGHDLEAKDPSLCPGCVEFVKK